MVAPFSSMSIFATSVRMRDHPGAGGRASGVRPGLQALFAVARHDAPRSSCSAVRGGRSLARPRSFELCARHRWRTRPGWRAARRGSLGHRARPSRRDHVLCLASTETSPGGGERGAPLYTACAWGDHRPSGPHAQLPIRIPRRAGRGAGRERPPRSIRPPLRPPTPTRRLQPRRSRRHRISTFPTPKPGLASATRLGATTRSACGQACQRVHGAILEGGATASPTRGQGAFVEVGFQPR